MKPGCFAAASVFTHDSNVCRSCSVFNECSAESIKTLEAIKGLVNVSDILKRHEAARKSLGQFSVKPKPTEPTAVTASEPKDSIVQPVERKTQVEKVVFAIGQSDEEIISRLQVKPQEHARRLCSQNLIEKIKLELQNGRNALAESKPRFIAIAIDALIKNGFSKSELRETYVEELGWGVTTASSHVSIVCPILTAFGIAFEQDNKFLPVLTPKSSS